MRVGFNQQHYSTNFWIVGQRKVQHITTYFSITILKLVQDLRFTNLSLYSFCMKWTINICKFVMIISMKYLKIFSYRSFFFYLYFKFIFRAKLYKYRSKGSKFWLLQGRFHKRQQNQCIIINPRIFRLRWLRITFY